MGNRAVGKGLDEPCLICGERRFTEWSHFPTPKREGLEGEDTIPLCPTHHKLLDHGRLSRTEFETMMQNGYKGKFKDVEEFIKWAVENCYEYNVVDLKRKFWDYDS